MVDAWIQSLSWTQANVGQFDGTDQIEFNFFKYNNVSTEDLGVVARQYKPWLQLESILIKNSEESTILSRPAKIHFIFTTKRIET